MRKHQKPVRKCHGCRLNLGSHCWLFACPRGQWRNGRRCRVYGDQTLEEAFAQWCKLPDIKSRRELRQETHRLHRPSAAGEGAAWLRERGLW